MRSFILFICCCLSFNAIGQLEVSSRANLYDVIEKYIETTGIDSVFNISLKGNLTNPAMGIFNGRKSNLGFNEGLLLTTGSIFDALGPNDKWKKERWPDSYSKTVTNEPGDVDLNLLINCVPSSNISCSQDASILEFDFIPSTNKVHLTYIFASDEYPIFTCGSYNDAIGIFLSGYGINGSYSNGAINIAVSPNKGLPVSVNTVNSGIPGQKVFFVVCSKSNYLNCDPVKSDTSNWMYFVNNGYGGVKDSLKNDTCPLFLDRTGNVVHNGNSVQYNGFTTPLVATATVVPNKKYHIKIAVADVKDGHHESALFLMGNNYSYPNILADFSFIQKKTCAIQRQISFKNYSFAATDSIVSWLWDFGDGNISSEKNPIHIYTTTGQYNVSLKMVSLTGKKDSVEKSVNVINYVIPGFSYLGSSKTIYFKDTSFVSGTFISSWLWDFGDGNTSSEKNISHTFDSLGIYRVKLIITTVNGCKDSVIKNIQVPPVFVNIPIIRNHSFSIFPNPSQDGLFTLHCESLFNGLGELTVFNTLGEKTLSVQLQLNKDGESFVNLSGSPPGVYFAQIQFPEGVVTQKIIIRK